MGNYIIESYNDETFKKVKKFIKQNNGTVIEKFKDPITLQQYYKVEFGSETITIDFDDMVGIEFSGSDKFISIIKDYFESN